MKPLIPALPFVLIGVLLAPHAICQNKIATSVAARNCHKMLAAYDGKDSSYFSDWENSKVSQALDEIDKCARESYDGLTRFDLAVAVVVTGWLKDNQRDNDTQLLSKQMNELRKLNTQLLSEASQKTVAGDPDVYDITIETIPSGFSRILQIGGKSEKCSADGPQSMSCEKYVEGLGYWPDQELVVMVARVKRSYGTTSHLIGCPASQNCAPLVPGDYQGKIPGGNAIVIGGLVTESNPKDPPHHGIYTILGSL